MIVFDTETTGLAQPGLVPLDQQPEIIEFAAVRLDDETLEEVGEGLSFLVRPKRLPLPPVITKITGIRDEDLKGQAPFAAFVDPVTRYFLGEETLVAHNVNFDCTMLEFELRRLDLQFRFPWPHRRICTIECSKHLFPKFPNLDTLYEYLLKRKRPGGAHRALQDVRDLAECVRVMRAEGLL